MRAFIINNLHKLHLLNNTEFWWRCVRGKHPFPSRTRWLRPGRPKILHWGRCGKIGGCQILVKKGSRKAAHDINEQQSGWTRDCSSWWLLMKWSKLFLENCTLKQDEISRHRNNLLFLIKRRNSNQANAKHLKRTKTRECNAIHSEMVKQKRAQGECLGTGSRRRTW